MSVISNVTFSEFLESHGFTREVHYSIEGGVSYPSYAKKIRYFGKNLVIQFPNPHKRNPQSGTESEEISEEFCPLVEVNSVSDKIFGYLKDFNEESFTLEYEGSGCLGRGNISTLYETKKYIKVNWNL